MWRRRALLAAIGALAGCSAIPPPLADAAYPATVDGSFVMPDGATLPMRAWLPGTAPNAVMLALHGFNDSRDAFEVPAPAFAAVGVAVYAPDQRGFGATAHRGVWAGPEQMTDDAAVMAGLLAARHPGTPLFLLGESMGGAVLLRLAATQPLPGVAGLVLVAPAVWGRDQMNLFLRSGLWLVAHTAPGASVHNGGPVRVRATDNVAALRRLSRDPLTLHDTRFGTLRGLVDLMDDALGAGPLLGQPGCPPILCQYGAHDELVPPPAMRAAWRGMRDQPGVRLAYYPRGYHLLLRDIGRAAPTDDIFGWMRDPAGRLLSGADARAAAWLERSA